MDRINLTKGLIAFGGAKGIGKTRFTLKLANHLAKKDKVLFVSYQDYKDKLLSIIEETDENVNTNLEVNTTFSFFEVRTLLDMIEYIKPRNFGTVIIDDIDTIIRNGSDEIKDDEKDSIVRALLFIANYLSIRIIVNLSLPIEYIQFSSNKPQIRDFNWSRTIINECKQIYALYHPVFYGFTKDMDGNPWSDRIEILSLKNEDHQEKTILFDNNELNIYPIN